LHTYHCFILGTQRNKVKGSAQMAHDVVTRVLTGEKITVRAIREGSYLPVTIKVGAVDTHQDQTTNKKPQ